MQPLIDSQRLQQIFRACLDESLKPDVVVEGVLLKNPFKNVQLQHYEPEIKAMLTECPLEFKEGWSFLNLCFDRSNCQWTDYHLEVDMLVSLGLALGYVRFLTGREFWPDLPGGMPYLQISLEKFTQ